MKPKDVNPFNWHLAWVTLYGSARGELPLPKFRVGDTVRVSRYKSTFGKGYKANFTEEIFKVKGVLRGDPTVYELEDHEGEPIIRKFYEEELSTVNKKDDTYRAEDTLKEERHGAGKVVGVRQSVVGTVGKHPERSRLTRYPFLTAAVRKDSTEGQKDGL